VISTLGKHTTASRERQEEDSDDNGAVEDEEESRGQKRQLLGTGMSGGVCTSDTVTPTRRPIVRMASSCSRLGQTGSGE